MEISTQQYNKLSELGYKPEILGDDQHTYAIACYDSNQLSDLIDLNSGAVIEFDKTDIQNWSAYTVEDMRAAVVQAINMAMYWHENS